MADARSGIVPARTGDSYVAAAADLDLARDTTRARIDAGTALEGEAETNIEDEL